MMTQISLLEVTLQIALYLWHIQCKSAVVGFAWTSVLVRLWRGTPVACGSGGWEKTERLLNSSPTFLEALWMSSPISELFFWGGVQVVVIQAGGETHPRVNQCLRVKLGLEGISDNAESWVAKTQVYDCVGSSRRAASGQLGASEHSVPHTVPGRQRA